MTAQHLSHILIFKTNIGNEGEKQKIAEALNALKGIEEWSVDCEDVDCVLRVVTYHLQAYEIIKIINQAGFFCVEMED